MASVTIGGELDVEYSVHGPIRSITILGKGATVEELADYLKKNGCLDINYWNPPPCFPSFIIQMFEDGHLKREDFNLNLEGKA